MADTLGLSERTVENLSSISGLELMEENRRAQEEEKLALTSIYTEDFLKEVETGRNDQLAFLVRFSVALNENIPPTTVIVTIHLPPTYPRIEPPVYEIKEAYGEPAWITDDHRLIVKEELQGIFDATAVNGGEHGVVLFEWIEWLKGWLNSSWYKHLDQHAELIWRHQSEKQRKSQPAATSVRELATLDSSIVEATSRAKEAILTPANVPLVFHSKEPLIDRKSVFVAHVASVYSVEDVQRVKEYLLSNPKIAKATHNILAYRIVQPRVVGKGKHAIDGEVTSSDYDDDGENAAGGRLLHLLELCKCRNVVAVVSRWYGGTLLGADRFKHINNVARELLQDHGFIP